MIDLHTHTLLSDGALVASELVRRAQVAGYEVIALTDHVDASNLEHVVTHTVKVADELRGRVPLTVVPGVEITHVPPSQIRGMIREARRLGARIVVVHGETIAEPVAAGTNRAAIKGGVDILAHPGLISPADARLAAANGVALEITSRRGHSLTNGHVANLARSWGAPMVLNSDAHAPADLLSEAFAKGVAQGAGLKGSDFKLLQKTSYDIIKRTCS